VYVRAVIAGLALLWILTEGVVAFIGGRAPVFLQQELDWLVGAGLRPRPRAAAEDSSYEPSLRGKERRPAGLGRGEARRGRPKEG